MADSNDLALSAAAPPESATALLIIDMISDWAFPNAQDLLPRAEAIAPGIAALKRRCRAFGVPVIYANDNRGHWRSDFRKVVKWSLQGPGAGITRALMPDDHDYFLLKPKHSAFFCTPLDLLLQSLKVDRLLLEALMRDYDVEAPADCTATQSDERDARMLAHFAEALCVPTPRAADMAQQRLHQASSSSMANGTPSFSRPSPSPRHCTVSCRCRRVLTGTRVASVDAMDPIRVGMTTQEANSAVAEVFANVTDYAVILLDQALRIAGWNAGAENLFGHLPEGVIGQLGDLIFTPEDRQQRAPQHEAATARASGRAHDDRWHVRMDGSRFWASGILVALYTPDGAEAGFAKIMRDRTDLRMQIDTAKNRLVDVVEEQERKGVMLGTLAHELRNPLAPLSNAAKIIRVMGAEDSRLSYPLQIIERQITFLQRLIDDLVDVSRVGAGKLRLELDRFVLQDALNDALDAARPDALARRQSLQGVLPQLPVEIEADRDRVVQIIVNLLNNAVRYTPPGGSIWLKTTLESGHAVMRVEDTGEGIAIEMQPRIFDLFTQGKTVAGRAGGLGIGLALVKELVAAHAGTVTVRSEGVGRGSEFTVRLPLAPPPAAPA